VQVYYADLMELFSKNRQTDKSPVYGTVLDGENIYNATLKPGGYILLGNESLGLSKEISPFITHAISIPKSDKPLKKGGTPDSLNVALSAAIVCSEFRRRKT
jgi:TrmH family RNA methyltransferase